MNAQSRSNPHTLTATLCHSAYTSPGNIASTGDCRSRHKGGEGHNVASGLQPAWLVDALLWSLMQIKEVFAVAGGAEGLVRLLGSSSNMDLLVETAWVICHATHSQADANRLVHLGLIQPAVQQIHACVLQVWEASRLPCFYSSHKHDNCIENAKDLDNGNANSHSDDDIDTGHDDNAKNSSIHGINNNDYSKSVITETQTPGSGHSDNTTKGNNNDSNTLYGNSGQQKNSKSCRCRTISLVKAFVC